MTGFHGTEQGELGPEPVIPREVFHYTEKLAIESLRRELFRSIRREAREMAALERLRLAAKFADKKDQGLSPDFIEAVIKDVWAVD